MDSITEFWNWFKKRNTAYLFMSEIEEDVKESLMDELQDNLHKYCDELYFEIGGYPNEDQQLIINADGNKDYFEHVEKLIDAAPEINRWTFVAFIPPLPGHFKSTWGSLELDTEEMWFHGLIGENSNDFGIRVYIKNYDLIQSDNSLIPLVHKMLDSILGEKSFALDVSYVDIDLLPDDPEDEGMYPIIELPEYISHRNSK